MRRLPAARRAQILTLLVEGMSLRAITRVTGASINTVTKLLIDAGEACHDYHRETVRHLGTRYAQVDEIWAFVYAKQRNVEYARRPPGVAGDGDRGDRRAARHGLDRGARGSAGLAAGAAGGRTDDVSDAHFVPRGAAPATGKG